MWDFVIKRELNKTIRGVNNQSIPKPLAKNKLNDLMKITKDNAPKGQKRELKNDIYQVKKMFKL